MVVSIASQNALLLEEASHAMNSLQSLVDELAQIEGKAEIVQGVREQVWPLVESGREITRVSPVIAQGAGAAGGFG